MRKSAPTPAVETPTTKRCASCAEDKPVAAFLNSRFTSDGRTDTCKTCTYGHAEIDRRAREQRRREAAPLPTVESRRASS